MSQADTIKINPRSPRSRTTAHGRN